MIIILSYNAFRLIDLRLNNIRKDVYHFLIKIHVYFYNVILNFGEKIYFKITFF